MAWVTPVTDRVRGVQYTYDDLNRVGEDVQFLADLLISYGYTVTVNPKTDWAVGEKQRDTAMTQYLADLEALKTAFYGTADLPVTMDLIDHEDANNIELLLLEIETNINNMVAGFQKCGVAICGTEVVL